MPGGKMDDEALLATDTLLAPPSGDGGVELARDGGSEIDSDDRPCVTDDAVDDVVPAAPFMWAAAASADKCVEVTGLTDWMGTVVPLVVGEVVEETGAEVEPVGGQMVGTRVAPEGTGATSNVVDGAVEAVADVGGASVFGDETFSTPMVMLDDGQNSRS
ncbi:hypothetical protein BCR44DRAFT_1430375 [Catenaria anguillulae PL171]|uniref:Uncharacterized protein n=1 Tax=Catenaria anguillulae PL171 TaxID=765915 RepID=A0A1Y2HSE9_9FUNG|nr:hypothetical protein BCR44DRAFT_1430375 [Catenaria anguillulae PL171]